ncbi:hypothetical protein ACHAPT_002743 [Fusarium lateritium]
MRRRTFPTPGICLVLLLLLPTAAAADDAEFAFNLFSDIAPILALFGDQFARQFMSESLTWLDHLIFAMVPLGIITSITGAIRVQGSPILRAFIGRAKENRALAELELMSLTSEEVCELFNGKSIVRAMGKPKIAQFLIFPVEYDRLQREYAKLDKEGHIADETAAEPGDGLDQSCGIHSLQTVTPSLMNCKDYHSRSYLLAQDFLKRLFRNRRGDEEDKPGEPPQKGTPEIPGSPNLQLNLSSDHFKKRRIKRSYQLFLAGVGAVILQAGLIAIAGVVALRLSNGGSDFLESKDYGFPCYTAGSILLCIGTGLCSFIVEQKTCEHCWEIKDKLATEKGPEGGSKDPSQTAPQLMWLQQAQSVNDQSFNAYAIFAGPKRHVVTSRRQEDLDRLLEDQQGKASESALSLVQSIELFMNEFFPPAETKTQYLDWKVEATGSDNERDTFVIPVQVKQSNSSTTAARWEVDDGTVEAALSLWMATIVLERLEGQKDSGSTKGSARGQGGPRPDWRRSRAGDDLTYAYRRILGDNLPDDVLKQDITWWVGDLIAEESDRLLDGESKGAAVDTKEDSIFPGLIIGSNGYAPAFDDRTVRELGITRNAPLPVILAQHLFTSFMWTVVNNELLGESLRLKLNYQDVDIDGLGMFSSSDFDRTWSRPKLRHRKLAKLVTHLESKGLGSMTEILLCIIPALSWKDLLPNRAILKLIPRVNPSQGLMEPAQCYNGLLKKVIDRGERKKLADAVIVDTVEFLYYAHELYDEYKDLPPDLRVKPDTGTSATVTTIALLASVYQLQHRRAVFEKVFRNFGASDKHLRKLNLSEGEWLDQTEEFARDILEFTDNHISLCSAIRSSQETLGGIPSRCRLDRNSKSVEVCDVFGWSLLHYACLVQEVDFIRTFFEDAPPGAFWRLFKLVDKLERNAIHTAALAGVSTILPTFRIFRAHGIKELFLAKSLGGMTPLHLASRNGNASFLRALSWVLEGEILQDALGQKDGRGRQPLHIAARFGNSEVADTLLIMGSPSNHSDDLGNFPVDYLLQERWARDDTVESDEPTDSSNVNPSGTKPLPPDDLELFFKFKPKEPGSRYTNGKTFLHIAATVADELIIRKLINQGFDTEAQDKDMRTPLHLALLDGRTDIALAIIGDPDKPRANLSARDSDGKTPLLCAVQRIPRKSPDTASAGSSEAVEDDGVAATMSDTERKLFDCLVNTKIGASPTATDSGGKTALHHAIFIPNDAAAVYLLGLEGPDQVQKEPYDNDRESLLVAACRWGCSVVVPAILRRWPGIINEGDQKFGQPPISWAIEKGHDEIVQQLMSHKGEERVDVNQADDDWLTRAPLHFAVEANSIKSLSHLLRDPSAKLDLMDKNWEMPLDVAFKKKNLDTVQMLLLDSRMPDRERIHFLDKLIPASSDEDNFWSDRHSDTVFSTALQRFKDEILLNEYLLDLVGNLGAGIPAEIGRFMEASLREGPTQQLKNPYHRAVLLGKPEMVEALKKQSRSLTGLDQDNWSCLDYARRLGRTDLEKMLMEQFPKTPKYAVPEALDWDSFRETIQVTPCSSHDQNECTRVSYVNVIKGDPRFSDICIRSDHCIPPPGGPTKHFYFEVEVLNSSVSRRLGVGFCSRYIKDDELPGLFERSWAYRGDDGELYIEPDPGDVPSSDFRDNGKFGGGDVVGVGLNIETGEGFCTRNGKKLNMGEAFQNAKDEFKSARCIHVSGLV